MATRSLNKLTARQAATLKEPGRHADGGGLYLRVTPTNSRSWVFMTTSDGRRTEIGLGRASAVGLATARGLAAAMREAVATGLDPRSVLLPAQSEERVPSFGDYADTYISRVESGWRNEVHRLQWRNSLRDHAQLIRDKPVDQVSTDDVIAVLTPIWSTKPETAKRVRGRIERVLDAAKAHGLRPRDAMNPATWRGHLALLMPAPSKLTRGHHAALPWRQAPTFMAQLQDREALAARCLEFVILTAARSGEALGATWGELDLDAGLWALPAHRMKAGVEHVVPLSGPAIELLKGLRPEEAEPGAKVFSVAGAARSNMAMTMLLRRMKAENATVHGFRSTFRDWAGDATNYPRELIEQALAHTIENKSERAYRRGTAVERRRELMQAWANYLLPGREPGEHTEP